MVTILLQVRMEIGVLYRRTFEFILLDCLKQTLKAFHLESWQDNDCTWNDSSRIITRNTNEFQFQASSVSGTLL